jgi:hypothetical protein
LLAIKFSHYTLVFVDPFNSPDTFFLNMATGTIPLEKAEDDKLFRFNMTQSVNMSIELFEKLYLSLENKVKGDLRRTFANPTPLSVAQSCSWNG